MDERDIAGVGIDTHGVDAGTGALLWRQPVEDVPGSPAEPPEVSSPGAIDR